MSKKQRRRPGEGEILTDFSSDWLNKNLTEDLAVLRSAPTPSTSKTADPAVAPPTAPPAAEPAHKKPAAPKRPPAAARASATGPEPAATPKPPASAAPAEIAAAPAVRSEPAPEAKLKLADEPAAAPPAAAAAVEEPTAAAIHVAKSLESLAGKYLFFRLAQEDYGVSVLKVREIIGLHDITALPRTPGHIKGVINLRGKVIPITDLRLRLNLSDANTTERSCIIVVEVQNNGVRHMMGMIVDEVSEVMTLAPADIESTPDFSQGIEVSCVLGVAKSKGKAKMLLDLDTLLGG